MESTWGKAKMRKEMFNHEINILRDPYRRLLRRQAKTNLIKLTRKTHPADLATLFRHFSIEEQIEIFTLMNENEHTAEFLTELDDSLVNDLLSNEKLERIASIIEKAPTSDQSGILNVLEEEKAKNDLKNIQALCACCHLQKTSMENIINENGSCSSERVNIILGSLTKPKYNSVSDSESDDEEGFDVSTAMYAFSRKNEKKALEFHPYLALAFQFGETKISKDLSKINDNTLMRTINLWCSQPSKNQRYVSWKSDLNFVMSEFDFSTYLRNNRKSQTGPTLFARILNAVDHYHHARQPMMQSKIVELINKFKLAVEDNQIQFNRPAQSGRSSFRSFCRNYNTQEGCSYKNCKFDHVCSFHAEKGIRANHTAIECRASDTKAKV